MNMPKEIFEYEDALNQLAVLNAEFSNIPGYIREKTGEELSIQEAKKIFGRFTPDNKSAMEANNNGGAGVNITLDDGSVINIPNQLELFYKVSEFNKKNGGFYDHAFIERHSQENYFRLNSLTERVENAKKALINSYPSNNRSAAYAKAREIETRSRERNKDVIQPNSRATNDKKVNYIGRKSGFFSLNVLLPSTNKAPERTNDSINNYLNNINLKKSENIFASAKEITNDMNNLLELIQVHDKNVCLEQVVELATDLTSTIKRFNKTYNSGNKKVDAELEKQNVLLDKIISASETGLNKAFKEVLENLLSEFKKVFERKQNESPNLN